MECASDDTIYSPRLPQTTNLITGRPKFLSPRHPKYNKPFMISFFCFKLVAVGVKIAKMVQIIYSQCFDKELQQQVCSSSRTNYS